MTPRIFFVIILFLSCIYYVYVSTDLFNNYQYFLSKYIDAENLRVTVTDHFDRHVNVHVRTASNFADFTRCKNTTVCKLYYKEFNKNCSYSKYFINPEDNSHFNILGNLPIFVLNLNRSIDRWKRVEEMIQKYSISREYLHRVGGIDHATDYMHVWNATDSLLHIQEGEDYASILKEWYHYVPYVTFSHLLAVKAAYDYGSEYSIIAEDDFSLELAPYWTKCDGDHPIAAIIREANFNYPKWGVIQLTLTDGFMGGNSNKLQPYFKIYNEQHKLLIPHQPHTWGAIVYIVNKGYLGEYVRRYFKNPAVLNFGRGQNGSIEYLNNTGLNIKKNSVLMDISSCIESADYLIYNECYRGSPLKGDHSLALTLTKPLFVLNKKVQKSDRTGAGKMDWFAEKTIDYIRENIYNLSRLA